ncbi:MAG TPA: hypothetical protein VKQ36_02700, partial [Ktedonobacterales bacterium]|nr:hypothetical protein [Ktedonobacterales bacterium]
QAHILPFERAHPEEDSAPDGVLPAPFAKASETAEAAETATQATGRSAGNPILTLLTPLRHRNFALLSGTLKGRAQRGLVAVWFFFAECLALIGLGLATTLWFALGCMALFGLLNGMGNVMFLTLVQRKLPRHLLGRIMGLFAFTNFAL